jgi:hypothetical protein
MQNLRWWLTAAEPRQRYVLLMAVGVMVMMSITYPVWYPGGPGMAAVTAMMAVVIAHVSAKLIMRR